MMSQQSLAPTSATLGELGAAHVRALFDALELQPLQRDAALATFSLLSRSWGHRTLTAAPPWANDLTDDGTPYEFSVGFERAEPEFRMLVESQVSSGELTQHSSWHAGLELQAQLERRGLCSASSFDRLAPRFAPRPEASPRFALWHAAVVPASGAALIKAYVNPEVNGADGAHALVSTAFEDLGLRGGWDHLRARMGVDARVPYLSLDLASESAARVKVYVAANDVDQVERLLEGARHHQAGEAREWIRKLAETEGPFSRPVLVCLSFTRHRPAPDLTVHVPIRAYVSSDEVALERARSFLPVSSWRLLRNAVRAMATGPLARSRGVLTYVSLRPVSDCVRVTAYLAPCAYSQRILEGESGAMQVQADRSE